MQIAEQGDFHDRIFPVVLEDAHIYKPIERVQYVKYWETKIAEFDAALKEVSVANMDGFREDIDLYTKIRSQIGRLTDILRNINALTTEMHQEANFAELIRAVERKLAE